MRAPIIPYVCQHLHLSTLSILILLCDRVMISHCILFCISLMTTDIEHIFINFLAIYVNDSFKFFADFENQFMSLFLFDIYNLCQYVICWREILTFNEVSSNNFFMGMTRPYFLWFLLEHLFSNSVVSGPMYTPKDYWGHQRGFAYEL